MATTVARELAEIGIRLFDEAYMSWSAAQVHCRNALHAWSNADPHQRADANAAYRAALDREEAAALDLERLALLLRVA